MSNNLSELIASAKDMSNEDKANLLKSLGINLSSNGTARIAREGEAEIKYVSGTKDKIVRIYPSDKGGIHFQGMPGTSAKWGITLYSSTIEFILAHSEEISDWMVENADRLSTEKPAKVQ